MVRPFTRRCVVLVMVYAASVSSAFAQLAIRPTLQASPQSAVVSQGELHGIVQDDRGTPLAAAVVSALGSTTAFAISDREGRFVFRNLPYGPYLVRAHLQGYLPARARVVQVTGSTNAWTIALTRSDAEGAPAVLAATVGVAEETPPTSAAPTPEPAEEPSQDEVAWRLRHLKRSVLKEAEQVVAVNASQINAPVFPDLPISGQLNLLTTASFDRPQDLFTINAGMPQGVAYLSLVAPTSSGEWTMRGTLTQGDVSSWIVAGSYARRTGSAHAYETGVSYSMQRYLGGNADALTVTRAGSRNVGAAYAYDTWTVTPRIQVAYGGKYARYDYLPGDRGLFSPRAAITLTPVAGDSTRVRVSVLHRNLAPGAEEFNPSSRGWWLPPQRTFAPVGRAGFAAEQLDHVEVAMEREWRGGVVVGVRAFNQHVANQLVTLFGTPENVQPTMNHYLVGSVGDLDASGWGVTVSRQVSDRLRGSIDYTETRTERLTDSPSEWRLLSVAPAVLRDRERLHDLTASVSSVLPVTSTRVLVVYKINNGFADDLFDGPGAASRFDVQVNQALPFVHVANAQFEMLVAVRNMFREDLFEGSVYDELLVVKPPKRVLGGVTVRF